MSLEDVHSADRFKFRGLECYRVVCVPVGIQTICELIHHVYSVLVYFASGQVVLATFVFMMDGKL